MMPAADSRRGRGGFSALINVTGLSAGLATFVIALLVAYDVIARTVFLTTSSWTTEVSMYLMGYITFVGAAYALKEGSHVSVDLLVENVRPGLRRVLLWLANAIMLVIFALLAWLSFSFFKEAWDSGEASDTLLSVRLWIPYLFFFIGMLWLLLVMLFLISLQERELTNKEAVHD